MRSYLLPKMAVAAVLTAAALAGCGGDPAPDVATAGSAPPAAGPSATAGAVAEYVAAQREWVKCMREQGFDLPDPDAKGRVDFTLGQIGVGRKTDPKFMAAQVACRKYSKELPAELEEREQLTPEQIANRRAYAACMREHGDPTFEDPEPDGNWPRGDSGADPGEEQARNGYRAGLICEPVLNGKPPNPDATEPPGAKG